MTIEPKEIIWLEKGGDPDPIGIILAVELETGAKKIYVGRSFGVDEKVDTKIIMELGAEIIPPVAIKIYNHFYKPKNKKKGPCIKCGYWDVCQGNRSNLDFFMPREFNSDSNSDTD
jgi:hypothetical protein